MSEIEKRLLSILRKATGEHGMIDDGDRIAVGLSGGKDSLALLSLLNSFKRFSPEKFSLVAITIDMGFNADFSALNEFCARLGVEYRIVPTEMAQIIFESRKEKNPCSLCSKMRRGALNSAVIELGCNKLALGHHADDLIETFFLSLFYEGRLSTFAPKSYMDRSGVTLIRPLIYAYEKDIAVFSKAFPVLNNCCPANHQTQREAMKNLVKSLQADMPFVKDRIFGALTNPERNNLWD